jgi:hypothetical protein
MNKCHTVYAAPVKRSKNSIGLRNQPIAPYISGRFGLSLGPGTHQASKDLVIPVDHVLTEIKHDEREEGSKHNAISHGIFAVSC